MPEHQRPRERMLTRGCGALTDAELVALLIGSGRQGLGALDLAVALLADNGGLAGLRTADIVSLARFPGIGIAKAARLVAALAIASRIEETLDARPILSSSADIARLAAPRFSGARRERVLLIVCGAGNRVLAVVPVAEGAQHAAVFPVREALAEVLRRDGSAFALAHNHPGGDPTPSEADRHTTEGLRRAAAAVGLRMLDHVVIAGSEWRSAGSFR
nr:DNA repair protein RadC [Agrococcus sp. KRD186]